VQQGLAVLEKENDEESWQDYARAWLRTHRA